MHQTFYIDVDEEITSVVERLRKAKANEIIMVVPKRALLIQSIVNLRLLKKEAESRGVQLMIVTQDKLGKLLVEKAGILVQQKLDEGMDEEVIIPSSTGRSYAGENNLGTDREIVKNSAKSRLEKLGSQSYFDENASAESYPKNKISGNFSGNVKIKKEEKNIPASESIVGKELVTGIGSDIKRMPKGAFSPPGKTGEENLPSVDFFPPVAGEKKYSREVSDISRGNSGILGSLIQSPKIPQEKKIERFFYSNSYDSQAVTEENNYLPKARKTGNGLRKLVLIFLAAVILGALSYGTYIYIPKVMIILSLKQKTKSLDFDITGDASSATSDAQSSTIPAKLISITDEITQNYPATGGKSASSQKAHGTITIYNEYSSSPQPLVATTRFLSDSGKLFRLVSGVTVPGSSNNNPGQIEATIIADQPGADYNINGAKFTIPGFEANGEKYSKIYATSSAAMTGGGQSGETAGTITQNDLNNAKNKIDSGANDDITQKIKEAAGNGMVVLPEAINKGDETYKFSNLKGDAVDNFQLTAKIMVTALVFKENDLKNMVGGNLAQSGGGKADINSSSIAIDYGKADVDFVRQTIDIKGHATSQLNSGLDIDVFKKSIAGKNNDEFESILGNYPDIEKAEINYWPPFISWKIPTRESRIDVQVNYVAE